MGIAEHRATAPERSAVRVAVISVSDTRSRDTDTGGALVESLAREAGFAVEARTIVPDDSEAIRAAIRALALASGDEPGDRHQQRPAPTTNAVDVVLLTGGTGVAPRDQTVETLAPLFQRRLDGFGELFRMLSFAEIGPAAMLSRACAGIIDGMAVFLMPGSPGGIRLAMERLILPELGHIVAELRRTPGETRRQHGEHPGERNPAEAAESPPAPQQHHHHHHGSADRDRH